MVLFHSFLQSSAIVWSFPHSFALSYFSGIINALACPFCMRFCILLCPYSTVLMLFPTLFRVSALCLFHTLLHCYSLGSLLYSLVLFALFCILLHSFAFFDIFALFHAHLRSLHFLHFLPFLYSFALFTLFHTLLEPFTIFILFHTILYFHALFTLFLHYFTLCYLIYLHPHSFTPSCTL